MRHKILVVGGLLVSFSLSGMEFGKPDKQLLKAAKCNKPLLLKWALWRGANPNVCDDMQVTPLHYCASRGDIASLQLLVEHGALVNALTLRQLTPLHVAISHQAHPHVIEWLLDHGALVDAQDQEGNTPLHCAAVLKNGTAACLLIQRAAQIDMVNNAGLLPEHIDYANMWSTYYSLFKKAVLESNEHLVAFFLSHGAQLDFIAPTGGTPMHWAAACLHAHKILPLLLEHAVERYAQPQGLSRLQAIDRFLNIQDIDGQTPLHWAAATNNFLSWNVLLRYGAQLSIPNLGGDTPLHLLAEYYHDDWDSDDDSLDDNFCGFLNCPIGSRAELPSEVSQSTARLFTFLCCLHRLRQINGIELPRDVLHIILRKYLFDDLALVPLGSYYKRCNPAELIHWIGFRTQYLLSEKRKYGKQVIQPIFTKLQLFMPLLMRHSAVLEELLGVKDDDKNRWLTQMIAVWRKSYQQQHLLMENYARVIRNRKLPTV